MSLCFSSELAKSNLRRIKRKDSVEFVENKKFRKAKRYQGQRKKKVMSMTVVVGITFTLLLFFVCKKLYFVFVSSETSPKESSCMS